MFFHEGIIAKQQLMSRSFQGTWQPFPLQDELPKYLERLAPLSAELTKQPIRI